LQTSSNSGLLTIACTEPQTLAETAGPAKRWASRVTLSIADQGFVSGAHFTLNILLARWLSPQEYGAFALTYSVFLFASGLHHSLILEPMSVIGSARYRQQMPRYLGTAVWVHGGLTVVLAIVLLLVAVAMEAFQSRSSAAMFGLTGAAPFMLLFWLFRRACYIETKPGLALKGSIAYALLLFLGLGLLWANGRLSAVNAFVVVGISSFVISLLLWRILRVTVRGVLLGRRSLGVAHVINEHWAYAKWSVRVTVVYWFASSIYLPLVGLLAGVEAVAGFRAIYNFLLPMAQVMTALGLLLLPWLSAQSQRRDARYLSRTAAKMSLVMVGVTGVYVVVVVASGPSLVTILYGDTDYERFLPLIPYFGAALIFRAIADTGFGITAKAAARPDIVFWATVTAAVVTVTAGVCLVWAHGARGAAAGWMLSAAAHSAVTVLLFRRQVK
jgi:O-antigen/teichoic acid export membrane protein